MKRQRLYPTVYVTKTELHQHVLKKISIRKRYKTQNKQVNNGLQVI